jgi:hypothetical protein
MIRIIPYYNYERDEAETWLADKAARGWELVDITYNSAKYKKAEPKAVRFRLDDQALAHMTRAEEEYYDLCRASGWEPVCQYGRTYVLRAEDENAVEMQTDEKLYLQELSKASKQHLAGGIILALALCIFVLALYKIAAGRALWARILVNDGLLPDLSFFLVICCGFALSIVNIISSVKLRARVKSGDVCRHRHRSPRSAAIRSILIPVVLASLIIYCAAPIYAGQGGHWMTPLTPDTIAAMPFPALEDIDPAMAARIAKDAGAREVQDGRVCSYDYYKHGNIPAPVQYEITERSTVYGPANGQGWMSVVDDEGYQAYYYRLLTRSLASALVNDLIREDADAASFAPISAPGFDEAYYYFQDNWQYILLRRDSAVLSASYIGGDKDLTQCLDIFARRLAK